MNSLINRHRLLWRLPFVWPYGPHKLITEDVNGGTAYHCTCGWSQGWISGDRKVAQRINRTAHRASKRTWR